VKKLSNLINSKLIKTKIEQKVGGGALGALGGRTWMTISSLKNAIIIYSSRTKVHLFTLCKRAS